MAPTKATPKGYDVSSTPLADFFWIAGLDGQDLFDAYVKLGEVKKPTNGNKKDLSDIIVEDEAAEAEVSSILESPRPASKQSKRDSYQRLSRLSGEAQSSIRSLDKMSSTASSARSSATIRLVTTPSPHASITLSDVDFDKAMRKFATDRDSFFLDINFSAGAVSQPGRARPRPKTQKIVAEDQPPGLSRGIGSVRRHMSFREMNSAKRQSTVVRQGLSFHPPPCAYSISLTIIGSFRQDFKTYKQLQLRNT